MKKILILILAMCAMTIASANAQVAVIVNNSVGEDALDQTKLAQIYTLKVKSWDDGSKIVVFDSKDDISDQFYSYIGKSAADLRKEWMRAQLTGEGKAPKALKNDAEVIESVAATPGAIGYVSEASVTDKVKVVATIK